MNANTQVTAVSLAGDTSSVSKRWLPDFLAFRHVITFLLLALSCNFIAMCGVSEMSVNGGNTFELTLAAFIRFLSGPVHFSNYLP